jgi:NTP pyrophosphatase (non-canonical NTP hydrolase)
MSARSVDRAATQERVRETMRSAGGYWRPLAAVARLLEELGELGESLAARVDSAEHASELADLWIITAALADQFLSEVAEPGSQLGPQSSQGPETRDLYVELVLAAGQIARIVNYYDGPKTPRTLDGWTSLGQAVADLHRALADIARAEGVDLREAVADKLRAIPVRDAGRFSAIHHDPRTAACLERFRLSPALARWPEIERAKLWGAPEWTADSPAANVAAMAPALVSFTKAAPLESLDGFVIAGPSFSTAESLAGWLGQLRLALAECDPRPLPTAAHTTRSLDFNGLRMSVVIFLPFHETAARSPSAEETFVLLCTASGTLSGADDA